VIRAEETVTPAAAILIPGEDPATPAASVLIRPEGLVIRALEPIDSAGGHRDSGRGTREGREVEDGSEPVIGALIEVHRALGPGLLKLGVRSVLLSRIGLLVNVNVTSLRQGLRRLSLPLPPPADLPDLFVGLLVPLPAAPFNSVESSY
jgi:hypothetical protein